MNNPLRIAIVAAAVVVLALIGVNLLPKAGGAGAIAGATSTPAQTSTAALTPAPTASPAPTRSPTPTPTPAPTLPPSGQVAPGTYRFDFITFTLPAGWNTADGFQVAKPDSDPPNGMFVNTWRNIATVYNDPCHWQTTAVSVGPTVDAVVAAFVAQKRDATVTPVDVTVDGFRGKRLDLVVPLKVKVAECDGGMYKSWTEAEGGERWNQGPGQHDLLDILDVNGQELIIKRSFWPANTAADLAELQAIFDSIRITP